MKIYFRKDQKYYMERRGGKNKNKNKQKKQKRWEQDQEEEEMHYSGADILKPMDDSFCCRWIFLEELQTMEDLC